MEESKEESKEKKPKKKQGHICEACNEEYRKQDYEHCPYCFGNGNGGAINKGGWQPSKRQKKEFAKKMSKI